MSPVLEERMRAAIGDATTCPHGHPMDEQNTYVYVKKDGSTSRQCKACALIRQRKSTKT